MTHGRTQTMTQGREGISLAHRSALKFWEVARQLSVVAVMFSVAAILAVTADSSYAGLANTVVVSNNGAILGGSVETFPAGSFDNAKPSLEVKGNKTFLGLGGASGDAVSSFNGEIVVTSSAANIVLSFGAGTNGNSAPDTVLAGPNTGINIPQGASFENPFVSGDDIFANSNLGDVVIADAKNPKGCPVAPHFTIGSITEFHRTDTGNHFPINNSPVVELPFAPAPQVPFVANATIAGCDTALFGPVGVAFDTLNHLWVVNSLGPFVTKYAAGAFGDAPPIDIVGLFPPTKGDLPDPQYIAVNGTGTEIYVTEADTNDIKIFDVHIPFDAKLINTISGKGSKLNHPLGIASNASLGGSDLYVVNNGDNSLVMFDSPFSSKPSVVIRQDNRNKRAGRTRLNLPVGVALSQFFPPLD
jgi:hypothetical protein